MKTYTFLLTRYIFRNSITKNRQLGQRARITHPRRRANALAPLPAAPAGISLANLAKVLKCAGNDDIVTMKANEDGDTVTFMFESPSACGSRPQLRARLACCKGRMLTGGGPRAGAQNPYTHSPTRREHIQPPPFLQRRTACLTLSSS